MPRPTIIQESNDPDAQLLRRQWSAAHALRDALMELLGGSGRSSSVVGSHPKGSLASPHPAAQAHSAQNDISLSAHILTCILEYKDCTTALWPYTHMLMLQGVLRLNTCPRAHALTHTLIHLSHMLSACPQTVGVCASTQAFTHMLAALSSLQGVLRLSNRTRCYCPMPWRSPCWLTWCPSWRLQVRFHGC